MVGKALLLVVATSLVVVPQALPRSQGKQLLVDKDKVQCPKAAFTSIQAAVNASSPGDTIKVCPDQYDESVNVTKPSLTLVGPTTVNPGQCSSVTAADPTRDAIVTGAASYSFSLMNNKITISGFVVQGSADGIDTSDAFSGYRITNNIAQNNSTRGIDLLSSGKNQSRVDHNCLRQNGNSGLQSEIVVAGDPGNLSNALVDHNSTYGNGFDGLDFSGAGARAYVTVIQNASVDDALGGVSMDNSIGSSVSQNVTRGTPSLYASGAGIFVGGANNGLTISGNTVTGSGLGNGIKLTQAQFTPAFTAPNVGLNVSGNVVTGFGGSGIVAVADAPNLTLSTVSNNTSSGNEGSGIRLQIGNDNNQVTKNSTDENGDNGIYADSAVGNTFANNHMNLNVGFDARDDNRPANTWTANQCTTDSPAGTICGS
jgi:Right handed beta helix region